MKRRSLDDEEEVAEHWKQKREAKRKEKERKGRRRNKDFVKRFGV